MVSTALPANPLSRWRTVLATFTRPLLYDGPWRAPEEEAYWEEQRESVQTYGRTLLLVMVVLDFLWWPGDSPAFRGGHALVTAFAVSRTWAVFSTLVLCAVMPFLETTRRHPTAWAMVQIASVAFVAGYEFGGVQGPGAPWFNYTPYILLGPATLPFRSPVIRLFSTLGLAALLCAGFFLLHPVNMADLRVGMSVLFVAGVVAFSMLAGVFTDGMRRRIYSLQRATQRQAVELRDLNEHLESRVQEQTTEVRRLASHLENARESERAHIARELHDELGQDLAAIRYALKFARIRYAQDTTAIGSYLDDLEQLLERTTATTRGILSSLRPSVVDDLGLSAAAEWLTKRVQDRTGIQTNLVLPGVDLNLTLSKAVAATAFRILQESLTNAARHAQAKNVMIELRLEPDALVLSVKDDGVGFEQPPLAVGTPGIGLIGIRERVLALGGTLRIDSEPNRGTHVHVRLPLVEPAEGVAA